jgi:vancomycin resistance protein YoaR
MGYRGPAPCAGREVTPEDSDAVFPRQLFRVLVELLEKARSRLRRLPRELRILLFLVSPCVALFLSFGFDRALQSGRVLRSVWASAVALSGLSKPESERAVRVLAERLERLPARVELEGQVFELEPKDVGYRIDVEGTVLAAFARGRQGGPIEQLRWWLRHFGAADEVTLVAALDREKLRRTLDEWEHRALGDRPHEGGVAYDGSTLVPVYPRPGRGVDLAAAQQALLATLGIERRDTVVLPTRVLTPRVSRADVENVLARARPIVAGAAELVDDASETRWSFSAAELGGALRTRAGPDGQLELELDTRRLAARFDEIRKRLAAEPADAKFEVDAKDRVRIVPSRTGVTFDQALVARALLQAAVSPARIGVLPLSGGEAPAFSTEAAQALKITGLVSHFTTHHACCQPRVQNIHRIADLLDGKVVKPGETFSVNAVVGERTLKNGFVMAPSIEDGEMVDALGGGISQFATTFFNAVFHGGYAIIERQPHTYWFSRYPMGHEATLSYPKPDIIFKNDTESGVLIDCAYSDTHIKVKLFGDNGGRKVRAEVSARFDTVEPTVELVGDPSVLPDEEKVDESGMIGWSINVGRVITFSDGTRKEEKRKVTYKPRVRKVRVHPCRIPEGEPGHTGEKCPDPGDGGTTSEAQPEP